MCEGGRRERKLGDSMIKDKKKGRRLVKSLKSGQVDRQAISYKRALLCRERETQKNRRSKYKKNRIGIAVFLQ